MYDQARDLADFEEAIARSRAASPSVFSIGSQFIEESFNEARLRLLGENLVRNEPESLRDGLRSQWVDACARPSHRTWRVWAWCVDPNTPRSYEEACGVIVLAGSLGVTETGQRERLPSPLRDAPIERQCNYFLNDNPALLAGSAHRAFARIAGEERAQAESRGRVRGSAQEARSSFYEITTADVDRLDKVNSLICSRASEFGDAGRLLDRRYSPEAICAHIAEQARLLEQASHLPAEDRTPPGDRRDDASLKWIRSVMVPPNLTQNSDVEWWQPELRRWELIVRNLLDGVLPITPASFGWGILSRVMLIYWITLDARAEVGPSITSFQSWPWDGPDVFRRSTARVYVKAEEWPRFNRAVDLGLVEAHRRNGAPPAAREPLEAGSASLDEKMLGFEPEHPPLGHVEVHVLDADKPSRTKANLIVGRGAKVRPVEILVKGRTLAYLLKMVTDQPDQAHSWRLLLATGVKAGRWTNSSTKAMERAGRRVREALSPDVRGHWEQDGIGAKWRSK